MRTSKNLSDRLEALFSCSKKQLSNFPTPNVVFRIHPCHNSMQSSNTYFVIRHLIKVSTSNFPNETRSLFNFRNLRRKLLTTRFLPPFSKFLAVIKKNFNQNPTEIPKNMGPNISIRENILRLFSPSPQKPQFSKSG